MRHPVAPACPDEVAEGAADENQGVRAGFALEIQMQVGGPVALSAYVSHAPYDFRPVLYGRHDKTGEHVRIRSRGPAPYQVWRAYSVLCGELHGVRHRHVYVHKPPLHDVRYLRKSQHVFRHLSIRLLHIHFPQMLHSALHLTAVGEHNLVYVLVLVVGDIHDSLRPSVRGIGHYGADMNVAHGHKAVRGEHL